MTTTQRAATVAAAGLIVAAAGFLFLYLRDGSDTPEFAVPTTTTAATAASTTAAPDGTVAEPDEPDTTASTATTTTAVTGTEPDGPTATTTAVTGTDPDEPATTTGTEPEDPDEAAITTATTVPAVTVPIPDEPDEWWTYNPELEWPVTDRDRLAVENVYPHTMVSAAADVANLVDQFWSWYMAWGHPQGPALDLHQPDHREWLAGDAVGQLMYIHHRFWQQRLPVWDEVWNREFATARSQQRNKLIYLDSLGELDQSQPVGPSTLLYNPAEETTVWRYWGPIVRPVPNPTAPRRSGNLTLPDDPRGACGPRSGERLALVDWDCVHLGPASGTALGDWDMSWYYDIPHEHAAWYVSTHEWAVWGADVWEGRTVGPEPAGPVRYDPDVHGAPTSTTTVGDPVGGDGGWLMYLPDTVADGAGMADIVEAWKPHRPEGFPDDPDAYQQMWRHDVGGGSWHKEMGQLVLLVPADELVAWLEANGYDPQQMFASGWPNPDEELLIRNTWGRDWDRDNLADWRNRLADAVGWLEQGVEIGDSGNLAADIEAAIHISAWMDWAYRARLSGDQLPSNELTGWWNPSAWAPGVTAVQDLVDFQLAHRPDGWATYGGVWQGLYHQALADGYHPDAATGRLTHPALAPELAVWKEWAAAGEAERLLGFQAADGDLGPAPGDTWIPWYPEGMVPLENHYLRPEGAVAHWETVVDWWPDGGLEPPVHLPDRFNAFTVAGPYVAEAGGHLFETCLWATGGLFAAWSLPHPELEDASQNVTWIVRGIADRSGRVVKLAEPVNRPCIDAISRWQHEGNIPNSHGGFPTFEEHLAFVRTPLPDVKVKYAYDPATGLWTTTDGYRVLVPSQLRDDSISEHEAEWIDRVASAASNDGTAPDAVLEPSYQDWQQWETDAIETARVDYRERDLPLSHHQLWPSGWERDRQVYVEGSATIFNELSVGAELDTPARYTDWLLGSARTWPEGFLRSTYRTVSRHRQPGGMHWLYNDGTAVDVDTWALPASEWERWAARHEAGTLHAGVVITPHYVRHRETDRTIPAGHIGVHIGNDWSWANVELLDGSVTADGAVYDAATWKVYLTSCMEEGFPVFTSERRWVDSGLFSGFAPEASDVPVWTWPGALSYGPDRGRLGRPRSSWPRWTWQNHPDIYLPSALRGWKLPPADCAGIAAGRYTPDEIHPFVGAGNYPDWMSTVGDSPPEEWFITEDPFAR